MPNRKNRLKKGIESIKERIEEHKEKKRLAEEDNNEELVSYYEKEIAGLEKTEKNKEEKLDKS